MGKTNIAISVKFIIHNWVKIDTMCKKDIQSMNLDILYMFPEQTSKFQSVKATMTSQTALSA